MSSSNRSDSKYDFEPYDGTPGTAWDDFEERYMNFASGGDSRGYSIADYILGMDVSLYLGFA